MITYNEIYESARKERYSEQLQKLPRSFIVDVADYLRDKKEVASKDADDFSDVVIKTKKQIENAITLFKELMLRRKKKILGLVLIATETGISKQDFENMLQFEKELFEDFMKCIGNSDKKVNELFNGGQIVTAENEMVVFIEAVEEFIGLDGNKVGPFEKGQIANISKEIVNILFEDGKVEILENN